MTTPPPRTRAALPDMELAALSAAGDRSAFGELVRRHGGSVRALLRRMGAEPAAADDAAQDAFLAAFERIGEFRGDGAFPAWVRRIAARLYARRARRHLESALAAPDPREGGETVGGGGEGEAVARLDLDAALATLAHAERLCVSMAFGAGLTHAEIADALGAPVGTVKSHIKRGLEKLRRRMGAEVPAAPASAPPQEAHHA